MDVKVYKKEEVKQPRGSDYYFVPGIIDFQVKTATDSEGNEIITGSEELDDNNDLTEQASALVTIWQRGLDPVSPYSGVRWSETLLGELNPIQLMEDIRQAVEETALSVTVLFDTFIDANGNECLQYKIQGVA